MPFQTRDQIRYLTFDSLGAGIAHAVFTRRGGSSPAPWASLNLGGTVGDDPDRVRANRARAFAALGRDPASLYDVWQVHGVDVIVADAPRPPGAPHPRADILLTDRPRITLLMRFADCVPLLFHDPVRRAVGIAHAGWLGTVRGVAGAAVAAMGSAFGTRPQDLRVGIGPSIGPDHYEVGAEVVLQVRQAFGADAPAVLRSVDGRVHFDLWQANLLQLERAGVTRVELGGLCTACHPGDWYSHRLERGRTGRFGVLIALEEHE